MNNVGELELELVWTLGDEDQCHWVEFEEWGMRVFRRPCLEVRVLFFVWKSVSKLADLPVGAGGDFLFRSG